MSEPQLILDYASPRKRGKVRLPANSELKVATEMDGAVKVVETLAGRDIAVMAVIFGLIVAAVASYGAVRETLYLLRRRHDVIDFSLPAIMVAFALIELVLIVLIIRNTWRRTILLADARQVTLAFSGPLARVWSRAWTSDEVGESQLIPTQAEPDAVRLAELRLQPPGMVINLFTDHREMELAEIAARLKVAISGEAPLPPVAAQTVHVPDPLTFDRLRERRQELHDRLH